MAAPFERAFEQFATMQEEASKFTRESAPEGIAEAGEVMAIHYREEEAIYIKASHDRVTVIFSTVFREETDRIFGKVFLQVRRNRAKANARFLHTGRSLSMPEDERYRTHHRFSTATSLRWSFKTCRGSTKPAQERSAT